MRRTRAGWYLRGGLLVVTFGMAMLAFESGVGVSDRGGVPEGDLLTHIYYSLGLFVLGGLDLGIPTGGPTPARALLWVAYFAAPLITTSAVLEGAVRLLKPEWLVARMSRDHVVVVGVGRLGMLFLEALRERHPRIPILAVDLDAQRATVQLAQDRFGARFLPADVRLSATLDSLALEEARAVVLLTRDDLVNLEVAWRIAERHPSLRVIAHVADLGMRRMVDRVEHGSGVSIFNSHRTAARKLYQDHLAEHFKQTDPADVVVLAGFGRFGQTILEYLHAAAGSEIGHAVIVDTAGERQARLFRAQVPGTEAIPLSVLERNLDDPQSWTELEAVIAEHLVDVPVEPVFVIGTDDDQLNLRSAIALRALHPESRIFVRCTYESAFTTQIASTMRLELLAVEGMLRQALAERQKEWLTPPAD